ncbi:hypothetical protein [Pedobacter nototheniae]|uniref:Crp/Fnr family transcriptional regulator n=1 Tax=Pedobacter nototheniae TaxID=2488994 RepID=UPI00292D0D6D|nr:hypothetical protein [Pedobacter nototheniae]
MDRIMFSEVLNTIGSFSDSEQTLFQNEVKLKHVKKNEVLLQKGEVAKSVFFNLEGLFYQYNVKDQYVPNITDLHLEREWIISHKSFIAQQPADGFITAFTDGTVLELSIESLHYLIGHSIAFLQFNRIMENAASRVAFFENNLRPLEKYQHLLDNKPQLIQAFPLKMIAFYLKMTPETLSRVREKIVRL